jgi:hypothetical protein
MSVNELGRCVLTLLTVGEELVRNQNFLCL